MPFISNWKYLKYLSQPVNYFKTQTSFESFGRFFDIASLLRIAVTENNRASFGAEATNFFTLHSKYFKLQTILTLIYVKSPSS